MTKYVNTKEVGPGAYALDRGVHEQLELPLNDFAQHPALISSGWREVQDEARRLTEQSAVPSAPQTLTDQELRAMEYFANNHPDFDSIPDPISRPAHYASAVETIDAIEAWGLNYRLGNVVKYISRAGKKDQTKRLEDLRKALWYLQREIDSE